MFTDIGLVVELESESEPELENTVINEKITTKQENPSTTQIQQAQNVKRELKIVGDENVEEVGSSLEVEAQYLANIDYNMNLDEKSNENQRGTIINNNYCHPTSSKNNAI